MVTKFLVDPRGYCHRQDFFQGLLCLCPLLLSFPFFVLLYKPVSLTQDHLQSAGTCMAALMKQLREPMPDPSKCRFPSVLKFLSSLPHAAHVQPFPLLSLCFFPVHRPFIQPPNPICGAPLPSNSFLCPSVPLSLPIAPPFPLSCNLSY